MLRSAGWSVAFAVLLLVLYVVAVAEPFGQRVDASSLGVLSWVGPVMQTMRAGIPVLLAVLATAAVLAGLLQRRWLDTLFAVAGAGVVILGSGFVRDDVLHRPYYGSFGYVVNSYPSRHVAIGFVLSVVVVRLWPWVRTRPLAGFVVVAATTALAIASVATFAHRASDVLGGILFVGIVAPLIARGRVPGGGAVFGRHWYVWTIASAALTVAIVWACLPPRERLNDIGLAATILVGVPLLSAVVLAVAVPRRERARKARA